MVGAQPFDPEVALRQIDAAMEAIVDATYRAMGVDPGAVRKPAVVDMAWTERVKAAVAKAKLSPLWGYWESSVSPKFDDWQAVRKGFSSKPMSPEEHGRWLGRVDALRAEAQSKGIKIEMPDLAILTQTSAVEGNKIGSVGMLGLIAAGGVVVGVLVTSVVSR